VSVKEAVSILKDTSISLLITDLKMPDIDGLELLKFVSEHYPNLPKLVITGYPSVQDSLYALKSGAIDYLTKPFTQDELRQAIDRTFAHYGSVDADIPRSINKEQVYGEMSGKSEAMNRLFQIIDRVKDNRATVFVTGESG